MTDLKEGVAEKLIDERGYLRRVLSEAVKPVAQKALPRQHKRFLVELQLHGRRRACPKINSESSLT